MKTFFIIFFITSTVAAILYSYNLMLKNNSQNKKLRVLTKRNNDLQNKLKQYEKTTENIVVTYYPVDFYYGEMLNNSNLYISPIITSTPIRKLYKGNNIEIFDCCEAYNLIWYEVKVIIPDENKNIKGFVKKTDVKGLQVVENNLSVNRRK